MKKSSEITDIVHDKAYILIKKYKTAKIFKEKYQRVEKSLYDWEINFMFNNKLCRIIYLINIEYYILRLINFINYII